MKLSFDAGEMIDARLPRPLMHPAGWPVPAAGQDHRAVWLLSLIETILSGGPLRRWTERVRTSGPVAWSVPIELVATLQANAPLLSEVRHQVGDPTVVGVLLESGRDLRAYQSTETESFAWDRARAVFTDLGVPCFTVGDLRFGVRGFPAAPDFMSWLEEIFPTTLSHLGRPCAEEILNVYRSELPRTEIIPREALRFFAGFLRRQGLSGPTVETSNLEWARFEALFTPQNEVAEAESLPEGVLMLNPAAQIVRLAKEVRFIVRIHQTQTGEHDGFALHEGRIEEAHARLIDTLAEEPRLSMVELVGRLGHGSEEQIECFVGESLLLRGGGQAVGVGKAAPKLAPGSGPGQSAR